MKKITLLLFAVLLLSAYRTFSQATISVVAPPVQGQNYSFPLDLPDGAVEHSYAQGCFLITAGELSALLTQSVISFGFKTYGSNNSSPTGSMTIYLENTSDAGYSKGTSFTAALSGMTSVYSGTVNIPSAVGTNAFLFNLPAAFNYTGGGIYVAYDWSISSQPATLPAAYYISSTVAVNAGAYASASVTALPSLTLSNVRPACIFNAINTATNEAGVTNVVTPGTIAESIQNSYVVTAEVLNRSLNPLSNIPVTLSISGANTYSNVQVVPALAPGATQTLSFAAFTPSALGMQTVAVSVPADENLANNTIALSQEVTCNRSAGYPHDTEFESAYGALGMGSMCLSHFNSGTSTTLAAVKVLTQDYPWANPNTIHLYGVLRNSAGLIVATTNTVSWPASAGISAFQTFTYTQAQPLAANTDYYIGLAQTDGACVAYSAGPVQPGYFYYSLMNGTMFGALPNGCYGIEPVFTGPAVSAGPASVTACLGEQITLTASGADSYSWSAMSNTISNPLAQSITLQPATNDVLTVTGNDLAGCSNSATIALNLSFCLGKEATAAAKELSVYPNPSVNGRLQVSGLSAAAAISVYNLLGEKVLSMQPVGQTAAIDLSGQPQGAYLMQISDAQNQLKTVKIVNQ